MDLASDYYDEADYLRDYNSFLYFINGLEGCLENEQNKV